jgi:hypothetical protein
MADTKRQARLLAACVAAGVACAASGAAQPAGAVTAETIGALIDELGPQKAAEHVLNDSPTLEAVAAGVAGGRRAWLDVGARLVGSAESYLRDRLVQAFSVALQRDPVAVLAREAAGVPIFSVCAYDPFAAAGAPPTPEQFAAAVAQREQVLAGVQAAPLRQARNACLAAIEQLKTSGARPY